ncbi:MAG: DUF1573 domain-containing protein [Candidatus Omnitrophota bacterium]
MKQILFLQVLILCAPLCAWSATAVPVQPTQADASAQDPNVWDFGTVKTGAVLEHEFVLTNDSAKDLSIKDTTTSCGCTVSEIKKKKLRPGESTPVSIKLDTKGYSGAVKQFVYVNTDSLENPVVRFSVKANAVQ